MMVVEMHLGGRVEIWFQQVKLAKGEVNWEVFCTAVSQRFGNPNFLDKVDEFNKLQQLGSVKEYQEKFKDLRTLMLLRDSHLTKSYFVSSFISSLKEEIKPMLKLLKPSTSLDAFDMAIVQEQS